MIACSSRTKGAVTVFICFLAIYVYYLHPSTPYGDSTELMTVAWGLGVAHPPGYPLFILLYNFLARHVIYRFGIASLVARWLEHYFGYTCVLERAVSMHLVTALLGATTQLFLFLCVYKLLHDRPLYKINHSSCHALSSKYALYVAFGTVYLCGMSPVVMRYATESEVFGLHNLFISIILYLYISFFTECVPELNLFPGEQKKSHEHPKRAQPSAIRSKAHDTMKQANRTQEASSSPVMHKRDRLMRVAVFFCGLSFSNQHIAVLLVVPVALVVLWATRDCYLYCPSRWASLLAIFFTPALVPYVYLWISETYMPHRSSWGGTDTWRGLVGHFLREAYGTLQLHANTSNADFFGNCFYMLLWMLNQMLSLYGGGAIVLVTAMCAWIRVKNRSITFFDASFASFILFFVVVFQSLANLNITDSKDSNAPLNFLFITVVERFWMHPYIILTVWIGMCVGDAIANAQRQIKRFYRHVNLATLAPNVVLLTLVMLCGGLLSVGLSNPLSKRLGKYKHYRHPIVDCVNYHNVIELISFAPKNSIFLVGGDLLTMSLRYMWDIEGKRPDLDIISAELYIYDWFKSREVKHNFFPNVSFENSSSITGALDLQNFIRLNTIKGNHRTIIFQQYSQLSLQETNDVVQLYNASTFHSFLMVNPVPHAIHCAKTMYDKIEAMQGLWSEMEAFLSRAEPLYGVNFFNWRGLVDRQAYPWHRNTCDLLWRAVRNRITEMARYAQQCFSTENALELNQAIEWFERMRQNVVSWRNDPNSDERNQTNTFQDTLDLLTQQLLYLRHK